MIEVIWNKEDRRKPIKSWATNLEDGALEQAKNLAALPFLYRHVALMPDCHQGFGMPIGGVIATEGVVIPNAVGVDIGCGMCAQKTNIIAEDFTIEKLKEIMGEIRKVVPVGFKHRQEMCEHSEMPLGDSRIEQEKMPVIYDQYEAGRKQLGTLGGGNHFIEIQKGDDGFIWIMIHSGSRNLGLKVAQHYNREAKKLNSMYHSLVPEKHDLAFLPIHTKLAKDYMREMNYALEFALANRKKMMEDVKAIFEIKASAKFEDFINIHHNYAVMENHYGKNVVIHRKGATSARKGELGIIPGSQGTSSYIVKGSGNEESFMSCSHGAGRKMGRKDAQRSLNFEEEVKSLNDKGIVHSIRSVKELDEAPGSYKDIQQVMDNQTDLVEIVVKLKPLGVIKG